MEWTEDQGLAKRVLADIAGDLAEGQERYRENMPHMSELIYCLTAKYYDRFRPLQPTQRESLLFLTGLRLEDAMLRPHKKAAKGEYEGIFWSADLLDHVEGLGELKTTRISEKNLPDKMPSTWLRQMLGYMKANGVNEISLVALHLMGNYAPPFPTLKCWHGQATQDEIDENWAWLQARKVIYLDHAERGVVPEQFVYNEDWECDNCRYLIVCQANQSVKELRGE